MYGSQLWDNNSSAIETIYIQWRKDHRHILSVPHKKHCDLLPLIANNKPLVYILDCRNTDFYIIIISSYNKIINFTAKNKTFECTSTIGKRVTHLMQKYNLVIDK